ncbi:MAG: epoxyqueuosine reductase QueH [Lachnospiraceae bacterium]|nr:epoxyqueuosine reductase QueH [Lachnospiraceae bacterium]
MNYQTELENVLNQIEKQTKPSLLLHSCCAPCSSYCLEYLSAYFQITVFYYNPNIYPDAEYEKRAQEQRMLLERLDQTISFVQGDYEKDRFAQLAKGLEEEKEGGDRCFACYRFRLKKTASKAKKEGFDYFATTLTISPKKNAAKLNEIGLALQVEYGVQWLPADFKKKNGYQRALALAKAYGLYRQNYCGCAFSMIKLKR